MADGNYITQAQVIALFGTERELSYLTNDVDTGVVETTDLDGAIEFAESLINSYVGVRYLTPVDISTDTALAAFLRGMSGSLSEWWLRARKPAADNTAQAKYDQTIITLERIAAGASALPGAITPAAPSSHNPLASFSYGNRTLSASSNRIFTRGTSGRL